MHSWAKFYSHSIMSKIAIVILNWNGADMLRRYLPTVVDCSHTDGAEVIVADNASTDHSVDVLEKEFPHVRTIRLEQNYGYAEGYNRALRQVEADYYLLLNSDVEIRQHDWLEPLLSYMDSHAEVAACQPKVLSLRQPDHFEYSGAAGGYVDGYGFPFCRGRLLSVVEKDEGQYDDVVTVHWATGASLLVRSADYWQAGGLDGRFFAHMEEIDLCWRLRTMGRQVVCIPQSTVYHLGAATLKQGNPRKTYLNFRNNLLMLYKNLPAADLSRVLRRRHWLDLLAALHFLAQFDWANCKAVFRAYRDFHRMKSDFEADRRLIQQRRSDKGAAERTDFCILWKYYVKGCRRFCQL